MPLHMANVGWDTWRNKFNIIGEKILDTERTKSWHSEQKQNRQSNLVCANWSKLSIEEQIKSYAVSPVLSIDDHKFNEMHVQ